MCSFSHFVKTDSDLQPDFTEVQEVEPPGIHFISVTSGGSKKIQNHLEPISKYHGTGGSSEEIERAILEHQRERAEQVVRVLELRLAEL